MTWLPYVIGAVALLIILYILWDAFIQQDGIDMSQEFRHWDEEADDDSAGS